MSIVNIEQINEDSIETYARGVTTKFLGRACGSKKLYVNIDVLPPGTFSAKYHAHTIQEEFLLILSGSGILRMNGDESAVSKGDMIAKPCGVMNAHQFYNSGDVPMEILDVGTASEGDICIYPDEDVVLIRDKRLAFKKEAALTGWDSDPNK